MKTKIKQIPEEFKFGDCVYLESSEYFGHKDKKKGYIIYIDDGPTMWVQTLDGSLSLYCMSDKWYINGNRLCYVSHCPSRRGAR